MKGVAASIELDGHSFTELEASFWENWKDTGLVMPLPEYRFNKPHSQHRFDFAWPEQKLAVEIEGGVWINGGHSRGSGYIKNLEKYNIATEQEWAILRYHEVTVAKVEQVARILRRLIEEG